MDLYVYAGKHPEIPPDGEGVVRPGEVWQFAEEPNWGAWVKIDPPDEDSAADKPGPETGNTQVNVPDTADSGAAAHDGEGA